MRLLPALRNLNPETAYTPRKASLATSPATTTTPMSAFSAGVGDAMGIIL